MINFSFSKSMTSVLLILYKLAVISYAQNDLSEKGVALLKEAYHMQKEIGTKVWKEWKVSQVPFLYKTDKFDFLIDHPAPPEDFQKVFSTNLARNIWIRPNFDKAEYQAAYDINDILTVVMTEPDTEYNPCLWVLKAVHELFHIYQGSKIPCQPFKSKYSEMNELTFNYDYQNKQISALGKAEAIYLASLLSNNNWTKNDSVDIIRYFENLNLLTENIYPDSMMYCYKKLMEWKEGVAFYTEREIAKLSCKSSFYKPSADFQKYFTNSDYDKTFEENYSENNIFNPLRFVYSGVIGRMIFYYTGLAKAYLLDRLNPIWKDKYLQFDLDYFLLKTEK
jgi:hypothetical protein